MSFKILQNFVAGEKGYCKQSNNEHVKALQLSNFKTGTVTIYASNGDDAWSVAKFKDGTDMIFTADASNPVQQARLDVGNYMIKAYGDANDDVVIRLS